ncbi:putative mobile element transfer protein SpdA [Streptomyces avermitilis MA-4680 = NBRC 14893]|uniref:Mobile element transfer protein SpdA n=1 Tax=Streptomyces avermitilis (strain ATCC 31267 / DSM 46492 / JCM 5070 / NBRC 14893 / NCIMB 12804 / NRRL 8165 / MA-4680) TaxID=227882 RepID=Q82GB1_STRAW|nr:putative mobile element transfer protein SpdA [Streptomyces avermitilis MA-4680 = NBRC 14893]
MRAQLARVDAVLVQALIAAALSFAHIHDVAVAAGQDGWKAWAYPVSVDLLLVAAWRRLRSGSAKGAAWCWFVIALAASLGANVATGRPARPRRRPGLAAHPRRGLARPRLPRRNPPRPLGTKGGRRQPRSSEDEEHEPESDPEPPTPAPPAIEAPPHRPAVPVPAALIDHARKVAAEHHTRTGTPMDVATLRARLGVPAPMAEAIAAHL